MKESSPPFHVNDLYAQPNDFPWSVPLVVSPIFEVNQFTIIVYLPIGLNFKTFLSIHEFSAFTKDFLVELICEIFQGSGLNSMCTWKLVLLPCDQF